MNAPIRTGSTSRGFTLVELLITVAIVSILAAIAYPAYQSYVVRTNRSVAKACLGQYVQFMERHYTTTLTYVGADPVMDCSTEGGLDTKYVFSVADLDASTYSAIATPTSAWASRDSRCGVLTIDQAGERSAGDGSTADVTYCW
jgi:type IV pilus assembly protein PilE